MTLPACSIRTLSNSYSFGVTGVRFRDLYNSPFQVYLKISGFKGVSPVFLKDRLKAARTRASQFANNKWF